MHSILTTIVRHTSHICIRMFAFSYAHMHQHVEYMCISMWGADICTSASGCLFSPYAHMYQHVGCSHLYKRMHQNAVHMLQTSHVNLTRRKVINVITCHLQLYTPVNWRKPTACCVIKHRWGFWCFPGWLSRSDLALIVGELITCTTLKLAPTTATSLPGCSADPKPCSRALRFRTSSKLLA